MGQIDESSEANFVWVPPTFTESGESGIGYWQPKEVRSMKLDEILNDIQGLCKDMEKFMHEEPKWDGDNVQTVHSQWKAVSYFLTQLQVMRGSIEASMKGKTAKDKRVDEGGD